MNAAQLKQIIKIKLPNELLQRWELINPKDVRLIVCKKIDE